MTITPIVVSSTPKIAGKALYLELVNNPDAPEKAFGYWYKGGVKQVIILPQHLDEVGIAQPVQIWSRVVSAHSPRSQWETESFGTGRFVKKPTQEKLESSAYHLAYDNYSADEISAMTDRDKYDAGVYTLAERLKGFLLDTHFGELDESGNRETLVSQNWVIRDSKPLAVEVLFDELEQARSHKTPQAIIRRIQKARVSAGFPEKLF
jgi:hypothetical protein